MNKERSGWRDERISAKHREWGAGAEFYDLDFVGFEASSCEPRAIVEYKEKQAEKQNMSKPQYKALRNLSDMAKVAFFNVRYEIDDKEVFHGIVTPLNEYAKKYLPQQTEMEELEYIAFLYALRNKPVPGDATLTYWANKGWYAEDNKPLER